ncbi:MULTISPECIES: hypothetical protein [Cupriavidus]|uniref:Uncharacterized protein n=1 Tax=Cupriavidus pauculus TaxID=82633 RepID=A0A5P2H1L3_9BURK|nr:hypothetical protein [Cupriavidus pauculus]QET01644.1 hypothetical protein FOB72_06050 [Cupriavidus pauculus]
MSDPVQRPEGRRFCLEACGQIGRRRDSQAELHGTGESDDLLPDRPRIHLMSEGGEDERPVLAFARTPRKAVSSVSQYFLPPVPHFIEQYG